MIELNNIYHCNCLEMLKRIDDNFIHLVVTSPPYYNAKEYSQYDNISSYMEIMRNIFIEVERILKPSRMCIINISPVLIKRKRRSEQSYRIPLPFYFVPMMEGIGFEFLEDIIWKKPNGAVPNRNGCFYRHRKPVAYKPNIITEYILVFKKKASFLIDKVLKNEPVEGEYEKTNVWEFNPKTNSSHPAPFPRKLVERCIKYYSYKNEIICDPFIGSGTSALVAQELERNWIGCDIKQEYCKMACKEIGINGYKKLEKI